MRKFGHLDISIHSSFREPTSFNQKPLSMATFKKNKQVQTCNTLMECKEIYAQTGPTQHLRMSSTSETNRQQGDLEKTITPFL